jgi:DNA polymerase I-like protein with 3'-5' exonuclease and polymerase domains
VAYIDYEQQEFGIAAFLSGDEAMMHAYRSGDAYLAFAKQAGAIPPDATKQSHKAERDLFKNCALAVQYGMGDVSLGFRLGLSPAHGRELLEKHRSTYPGYWKWSEAVQDHAMFHGILHTTFGWCVQVGHNANPRSLRNFPIQANGAEMLRLAIILAHRRGVEICAPVHDALLIEADVGKIEEAVATCQQAMKDASELVLPGFPLRTDAKIFRYPERYSDERGTRLWDELWSIPLLREALERMNTGPQRLGSSLQQP